MQVYSASYSQAVTHPGSDQAERCLILLIVREYEIEPDMAARHIEL